MPTAILCSILLAALISLLVAVTEVASAFSNQPFRTWRAVVNRWAWLYYALFALLTAMIGMLAYEGLDLEPSWAWTIAIGLLGPTLLKSNISIFKPVTGSEGFGMPFEKLIERLQAFIFSEISDHLATVRIEQKENLTRLLSEEQLLETLRTLYPADGDEWEKINLLIEERQESDPGSVRPFMVELIERKDHNSLERLARRVGGATELPEAP